MSLRAPPPLERPLAVERAGGRVDVRDGDTVVAEGHAVELGLQVPEPVSVEAAEAAARAGLERWFAAHPFPTCVVCGPEREAGDGYRIFPGPAAGREMFAATWTPDVSLADANGNVRPECVWAALDCPTSAPAANFGQGPPVVLARLAARLEGPVEVGGRHVVVSWGLEVDGRKRRAASALFTGAGRLLALGEALWIELRQ